MIENKFDIPVGIPENARKELEKLLEGNLHFVNGTVIEKNMCVETLKKFASYQEPFAVVLTCSDSRVVPEIIFNCGIGEIFVIRVAGVTTGPNIIESVEYAVKNLKVPLLIILGHDDCGVMKYAFEEFPKAEGDFCSLLKCVYPVFHGENNLEDAQVVAKKHTYLVEEVLLTKSKIIREAVDNKELFIADCHLDHMTGVVSLI